MKKISKKIVFFGTDEFSLATLQNLVKSGYDVSSVVTKPDSRSGRGQREVFSSVKKFALENDIEVWQPNKVSEIDDNIKLLGKDVVGILVSYGKIIPQTTIDLFNPGIINLHPSILPKYRGPSPIETSIVNGDKQTGISIMKLSAAMDAGPIYIQKIVDLSGEEDSLMLREEIAREGAKILVEILPGILDNSIQPKPQDDSEASYCKMIGKDEGLLDTIKISAIEADRKIRAHIGFPKTKICINNHMITITKAHIADLKESILDIKCCDGKFISIDELVGPSGRKMKATDFINGYS